MVGNTTQRSFTQPQTRDLYSQSLRVGGLVEAPEVGFTPLLLPVQEASSLQDCITGWADRGLQYALLQAPPLLPVVLCRWQGGGKNQASVTGLRETLSIPVWQEGQNRQMVHYRLAARVFHIGEHVMSGHYRAFRHGLKNLGKGPCVCASDLGALPEKAEQSPR